MFQIPFHSNSLPSGIYGLFVGGFGTVRSLDVKLPEHPGEQLEAAQGKGEGFRTQLIALGVVQQAAVASTGWGCTHFTCADHGAQGLWPLLR